jgi:hypothetical protein
MSVEENGRSLILDHQRHRKIADELNEFLRVYGSDHIGAPIEEGKFMHLPWN